MAGASSGGGCIGALAIGAFVVVSIIYAAVNFVAQHIIYPFWISVIVPGGWIVPMCVAGAYFGIAYRKQISRLLNK